jgi:hypothetical protein
MAETSSSAEEMDVRPGGVWQHTMRRRDATFTSTFFRGYVRSHITAQLVSTRIAQVVIAIEKHSPQTILMPWGTLAPMCVYRNRCMGLMARIIPTREFLPKSSHTSALFSRTPRRLAEHLRTRGTRS